MIRKILSLSMVLLFALGITSCKKEAEMWDNIPLDEAYNDPSKLEPSLMGAYYTLGNHRVLGNFAITLGDCAADVATASPATGHLVGLFEYNVTTTLGEPTAIWNWGYKVIDRCVRVQNGCVEAMGKCVNNSDTLTVLSAFYQSYALRALTNLYLVNIFALPYRAGTANDGLGIVIVDKEPIEPFSQISRATVAEVYAHIDDCIAQAKNYYAQFVAAGGVDPEAFYINAQGISAIEARVALYKGEWARAVEAADNAIAGLLPINANGYLNMWNTLALTNEHIFAIAKAEDDNLSANSINNQYTDYKGRVSDLAMSLFAPSDIRLQLLESDGQTQKWFGLPSNANTSNIPVIRLSEMYLAKAEANAQLDKIAEAQEALLAVASRDTAIASVSDLPSTKEDLLDFIEAERVRELYSEGHRWYDARRTGKPVRYRSAEYAWNVSNFCYPIPADEVNAGFGVVQTQNWDAALPNGRTEVNSAGEIHVSSVWTRSTLEVKSGSDVELWCSVYPYYADDKSVEWKSDNPAVATVDAATGVLTAVAAGTANITVTSTDGAKTAVCVVTVK